MDRKSEEEYCRENELIKLYPGSLSIISLDQSRNEALNSWIIKVLFVNFKQLINLSGENGVLI